MVNPFMSREGNHKQAKPLSACTSLGLLYVNRNLSILSLGPTACASLSALLSRGKRASAEQSIFGLQTSKS